MFSGSLGSVLLRPGLRARAQSIQLSNRAGNMLDALCFRACLVEGQWISWC